MNKGFLVNRLIKQKDVQSLFDLFYPKGRIFLTKGQREIATSILFPGSNRLMINAVTRYGKSLVATRSLAIRLGLVKTGLLIIGPSGEQTKIIRNYLAEAILSSPRLLALSDIGNRGMDKARLKRESSKRRQTFKNGSVYQTVSAQGDAGRIMGMGHEADIVLSDEDALISRDAQYKVGRMFADKPSKSWLWVKLCNPWSVDTHSYDCWVSSDWRNIHIDYKQAIREGRLSEEFVESERGVLPGLVFEVLYESRFPSQPVDALFNMDLIIKSFQTEQRSWLYEEFLGLVEEYEGLKRKSLESEALRVKNELGLWSCVFRVGVDVAGKGLDESVCWYGFEVVRREGDKAVFEVLGGFSEDVSDNMRLARRVKGVVDRFKPDSVEAVVVVDGVGVGEGVVSYLDDVFDEVNEVEVVSALFGSKPLFKDFYRNRKAEEYFGLADVFKESRIFFRAGFGFDKLKTQLMSLSWKQGQSTREKLVVVEPVDSPDYAESLVYFVWKRTVGEVREFAGDVL